jgi:hypothetical protein
MDRVAKIAQEVCVFLEYQHQDPRTRQQQPKHHAGRAPADYATYFLPSSQEVIAAMSGPVDRQAT